jgi:hypothetical protein
VHGAAVETEGCTMATTSFCLLCLIGGIMKTNCGNFGKYTNEEMLAGAGEPARFQRTKIGAMDLVMNHKNA